MSGGPVCCCTARDRRRAWVVTCRDGNHSYFGRGERGSFHRSEYVLRLPDGDLDAVRFCRGIAPGVDS